MFTTRPPLWHPPSLISHLNVVRLAWKLIGVAAYSQVRWWLVQQQPTVLSGSNVVVSATGSSYSTAELLCKVALQRTVLEERLEKPGFLERSHDYELLFCMCLSNHNKFHWGKWKILIIVWKGEKNAKFMWFKMSKALARYNIYCIKLQCHWKHV